MAKKAHNNPVPPREKDERETKDGGKNGMRQNGRAYKREAADLFLLGGTVSFLGWLSETFFCALAEGGYSDRGFLSLPFCPIYGVTVLAAYFLLGTPAAGGILLKRVKKKKVRLPLFFLLAVLLPTAAELGTGVFFRKVYHRRLWNYGAYPFSYKGYICLPFSLAWGILLTLFLWLGFDRLRGFFARFSGTAAFSLAGLLLSALTVDAALHFFG